MGILEPINWGVVYHKSTSSPPLLSCENVG